MAFPINHPDVKFFLPCDVLQHILTSCERNDVARLAVVSRCWYYALDNVVYLGDRAYRIPRTWLNNTPDMETFLLPPGACEGFSTTSGMDDTVFSQVHTLNLKANVDFENTPRSMTDWFVQFSQLESLILRNTRDGMALSRYIEPITTLTTLRSLDLRGCKELSDTCLTLISTRLPNLTALDISFSSGFTEDGLREVFMKLINLRTLGAGFCFQTRDHGYGSAAFEMLSNLEHLTSLDIRYCNCLTNEILLKISRLHNLTKLDIAAYYTVIDDHGIQHLFPLAHLKHLNIGYITITDTTLRNLCLNWPKLLSLDVKLAAVTPAGTRSINNLTNLTSLDVSDGTYEGLMTLTNLRRLQSLFLMTWKMSDDVVTGVSQLFPTLTTLLVYCSEVESGISAEGFRSLQNLKFLTEFSSHQLDVTDDGMKEIAKIGSLKTLEVCGAPSLTDAGMSALSTLTSLTKLSLERCMRVTDAGVMELVKLTRLRKLEVVNCSNGDDALRAVHTALHI
eukprot:PhF_6_TR34137/c0_g1_i7/m.49853